MIGRVKADFSFTTSREKLLFIFKDDHGREYLVPDAEFYKKKKLEDPVTKHELDSLLEDMIVEFEYVTIGDSGILDGQFIVTKINKFYPDINKE